MSGELKEVVGSNPSYPSYKKSVIIYQPISRDQLPAATLTTPTPAPPRFRGRPFTHRLWRRRIDAPTVRTHFNPSYLYLKIIILFVLLASATTICSPMSPVINFCTCESPRPQVQETACPWRAALFCLLAFCLCRCRATAPSSKRRSVRLHRVRLLPLLLRH